MNNTKDIIERKKVKSKNLTSNSKTAVLFGNPQFYSGKELVLTDNDGKEKLRGGGTAVAQLPGTEKEIKDIKKMLTDKGWTIKSYTEDKATEAILKSVQSPTILHIATHGFFDSKKANEMSVTGQLGQNPLLKSGLLTANAGDLLDNPEVSYNAADGVLTAYEAMNLNFDNTEIVIMSACETGLGKIEAGEGVFGLQRSFTVAGAGMLIMSLFKVSDEATQVLMTDFYRRWLETGKKRESFIAARKALKEKYPEPIYWGAFVIVGE
jgi:CHAT domain-containing protein